MYQFPYHLSTVHRVLKIDPANSTAQEVGDDVRPLIPDVKEYAWSMAVAKTSNPRRAGCFLGNHTDHHDKGIGHGLHG